MSLTYGFYNSLNGDRKYDANQLSSIFDGIIGDGVFATVGSAMAVTAYSGLTVRVGTGRAWFNHTWTLNDTILPITAEASELLLDRIDAVVLEINSSEGVRANSIKIIKGTPASKPVAPTMINNDLVHQYPLCHIYRAATSTEITSMDITNTIGTAECPFVTGALTVVTIDAFISQWRAQFEQWLTNEQSEYDEWYATFKAALQANADELDRWMEDEQSEFVEWFNTIKGQLSGDVAANLTAQLADHLINGNHVPDVGDGDRNKFLAGDKTWKEVTPSSIGAAESSHGTHVSYSSTAPVMDGAASVGSSAAVARSDHKHPTDTSRAPAYSYGTTDLTPGTSALATGKLPFVYE